MAIATIMRSIGTMITQAIRTTFAWEFDGCYGLRVAKIAVNLFLAKLCKF